MFQYIVIILSFYHLIVLSSPHLIILSSHYITIVSCYLIAYVIAYVIAHVKYFSVPKIASPEARTNFKLTALKENILVYLKSPRWRREKSKKLTALKENILVYLKSPRRRREKKHCKMHGQIHSKLNLFKKRSSILKFLKVKKKSLCT